MRARFSAYAVGLVDFIIVTTDERGPMWQPDGGAWRADIKRFSTGTRFNGLRILEAPPPTETEGFVTFSAALEQGGQDASFTERSRFTRREGRWCYHSGERVPDRRA